ncbi:RDD family protein [Flexivirga sp. ID2601S]|uniref:RDD family protein n=1 Tax=Flexivirga aerilata TaxID=1656889 RepID=A0A849APP1_9MICO|nr:RDD family protein [Flexivirga aerilata]NNG40280.1 RDD family protein [Flexivirga aerilata]
MTDRPSGWYDDPDDPDLLRYWDGILWSDRTMPKVKPGLDQSRIGDSKQQWEEAEARRQAAQVGSAPPAGGPRPPLQPYQSGDRDPYRRDAGQRPPSGQRFGEQGPAPYGQPYAPYAQQVGKTTPDGEPTASWWRRLVAYFLDYLLIAAVALVIALPWVRPWMDKFSTWYGDVMDAARAGRSQPPMPDSLLQLPWQYPLIMLGLYLVYEIGLVTWRGQTLGKMALGIRVRGAGSTARPPLAAVAVRSLVKGIPFLGGLIPLAGSLGSVFGLIDGLLPLGDKHAQSLHDKAAKTYVVPRDPKLPAYGQGPYAGPPQGR